MIGLLVSWLVSAIYRSLACYYYCSIAHIMMYLFSCIEAPFVSSLFCDHGRDFREIS